MTTETSTEQTESEAAEQTEPATGDAGKDWQAEYEKLQRNSRKWEERAKANADAAKELDALRQQSMTDLEKAVDEARKSTRAEVLTEVGRERVVDLIRATATGRVADVDALLDVVDAGRFLDEEGQPNREGITAWLDRVAPAAEAIEQTGHPAPLDLGQGARGGQPKDMALGSDPLYQSLQKTLGLA